MGKAITFTPSGIPAAQRPRVLQALFDKYGATWGVATPNDITAAHVEDILKNFLIGQVKQTEKSNTETTFETGFVIPDLES